MSRLSSISRGFTLVELLVVIAIISILAGMLLPALQRARGAAQNAACMSNQKQVSLYLRFYSDEHDGENVKTWGNLVAPPTAANGRGRWQDMLMRYAQPNITLGDWCFYNTETGLPYGVLACPTGQAGPTGAGQTASRHYAINDYYASAQNYAGSAPNRITRRDGTIRNPARRGTVMDIDKGNGPYNTHVLGKMWNLSAGGEMWANEGTISSAFRHSMAVNSAYADGHVAPVKFADMPKGRVGESWEGTPAPVTVGEPNYYWGTHTTYSQQE